MCFLVLHHQAHADAPLVLLATRDENYGRSFQAPARWSSPSGVFAPRDEVAGGTWLGLNAAGLLVGITNRDRLDPQMDLAPDALRSRGQLVLDALRAMSAREALAWVRRHLADCPYAGFHLLLADRSDAYALRHRGQMEAYAPDDADVLKWRAGAHTLSNLHDPNTVPVPPRTALHADVPAWVDGLKAYASDASEQLTEDVPLLKHDAQKRRGTVSASIVVVPSDPNGPVQWHFAHGRPGTVPWVTYSA